MPTTSHTRILVAALATFCFLSATPAIYGRRHENKPDKIGHRNVAHRSLISPEREFQIGSQMAAQFEKAVNIVQDRVVQQYVTGMANEIVAHSDWRGHITIRVINSSNVSSYSLPGGFIYLTSGMLRTADNEDEIAGVIAHQIAHAATRHWASLQTKALILQQASFLHPNIPAMVCTGFPARHPQPLDFLELGLNNFRQEDELEADYLGLQYVYEAGYSPKAYVVLLSKLRGLDAGFQERPGALRDAPPLAERIAKAKKEIRKILSNAPTQPKSAPAFLLVRSHLKALSAPTP